MINWSEQDMRVSRTELKKAHERLQQLATPLSQLSKKRMKSLPVSGYFLDELMTLADISSATARNRQIKRIGKLITEENRHDLVAALFAMSFTDAQAAKTEAWLARLNIHDDSTLKAFCKQFKAAERNSIYQLLLWIEYAKHRHDDELLAESQADLRSYLYEVALLSYTIPKK